MITTLIADEEVVPTYTGWGTCTTKGGTQTTIWKTGQVHGTRLHRWSMARDEEAWEQEKITDVDVPGGFTGWGYCTTQGGDHDNHLANRDHTRFSASSLDHLANGRELDRACPRVSEDWIR